MMSALYHDAAQRASDGAALMLTALLISASLAMRPAMLWRELAAAQQSATQSSIELSLESPPIESKPAPAPPSPEPQVTHARRAPKPLVTAPAPAPAETVLADAEPIPEDASVIADSAATPSPAAAQPPASHPDLDAQYAAAVRSDIDRRTHVPDSVRYRLTRPSGEVRVGFVLTRAGEPKAVKLRRSSGSAILDEAALTIVAAGHYAAMPANVFTGEAQHEFAVTIEFRPASLALRGP